MQPIQEESAAAQEPSFDASQPIQEESVVEQEPLQDESKEEETGTVVIVSLPVDTDTVVLESHQALLLNTPNGALVANNASSKKGRVTNATVKKCKSSFGGSVAPQSNDANSPSSKGGVTKPLAKNGKINEAQKSNEANVTSNTETAKASKK